MLKNWEKLFADGGREMSGGNNKGWKVPAFIYIGLLFLLTVTVSGTAIFFYIENHKNKGHGNDDKSDDTPKEAEKIDIGKNISHEKRKIVVAMPLGESIYDGAEQSNILFQRRCFTCTNFGLN